MTHGIGTLRIGQCYDIHALVPGRKLLIGGVDIAFDRGLLGHSDADVLLHAICDALLGAAGLGDIGQHYPDSSPQYADVDSRVLLRSTAGKLKALKHRVVNVDATIIAEAPRMAPHITRMIGNIAADLGVEPAFFFNDAATTERLGFVGRDEGIAAMAVALID